MEAKNAHKKGGMFEGALHTVFQNAKALRKNMTDAETVLWMHLKAGVNGCKFRRQHPIGRYIADFYCHKAGLIIEVDGSIHSLKEVQQNDAEKENYLATKGYSVLRFTNQEVEKHINNVLLKISTVVKINIHNQASQNGD